jgi:hypothetical protein
VCLISKPFESGYQPSPKKGPDTGFCAEERSSPTLEIHPGTRHPWRHLASCVDESLLSTRKTIRLTKSKALRWQPKSHCQLPFAVGSKFLFSELQPTQIQADRQPDHPPSNSAEPWRLLCFKTPSLREKCDVCHAATTCRTYRVHALR